MHRLWGPCSFNHHPPCPHHCWSSWITMGDVSCPGFLTYFWTVHEKPILNIFSILSSISLIALFWQKRRTLRPSESAQCTTSKDSVKCGQVQFYIFMEVFSDPWNGTIFAIQEVTNPLAQGVFYKRFQYSESYWWELLSQIHLSLLDSVIK